MRALPLLLAAGLLAAPPAAAETESLIGTSVKSDSWNVKRLPDRRVETFSGNVRYSREGRRVRADWAQYDHGTRAFTARGSVRARQPLKGGLMLGASGERARHDRDTGRGEMTGASAADPVRFTLETPQGTQRGRGRAGRAVWDGEAQTLALEGGVYMEDERGTALSERADYDHGARSLRLSGRRPVLTGREESWDAAVQAETVTVYELPESRRRVTAEGGTRGWLHFEDRAKYAGRGAPR